MHPEAVTAARFDGSDEHEGYAAASGKRIPDSDTALAWLERSCSSASSALRSLRIESESLGFFLPINEVQIIERLWIWHLG